MSSHSHPHKTHPHLYRSRWHLAATFAIVLLPLVYLAWYAQLTDITMLVLLKLFGISAGRLLIAYLIAVGLAWPLALLFYRGKRALVALPVFDLLQSFPTFAALPLAIIVWGRTNVTVIFFLVITVIWPIFFSVLSSLKRTNHEWYDVVAITGLTPWQSFRTLLWPISIPGLITGSIIGLGEGWEALVATEIIVAVQSGLGPFFEMVSNNPTFTALGITGLLFAIFSINKLIWLPLLEWSHTTIEES